MCIRDSSLRGARGNSGVILSQLLRGFTKEIKTVDEIDTTTLANAMVRGTETAYKAVMKPKEGTILTVAKGMADKALEMAAETDDIEVFAQAVIKEGDRVLNLTPEMLPVLKQAGVVDSGGQGLMQVLSLIHIFMIEGKVADEPAYVGRTYMDAPNVDGLIFVNADEMLMSGDFVRVKVTGANEYDLIGEVYHESAE